MFIIFHYNSIKNFYSFCKLNTMTCFILKKSIIIDIIQTQLIKISIFNIEIEKYRVKNYNYKGLNRYKNKEGMYCD